MVTIKTRRDAYNAWKSGKISVEKYRQISAAIRRSAYKRGKEYAELAGIDQVETAEQKPVIESPSPVPNYMDVESNIQSSTSQIQQASELPVSRREDISPSYLTASQAQQLPISEYKRPYAVKTAELPKEDKIYKTAAGDVTGFESTELQQSIYIPEERRLTAKDRDVTGKITSIYDAMTGETYYAEGQPTPGIAKSYYERSMLDKASVEREIAVQKDLLRQQKEQERYVQAQESMAKEFQERSALAWKEEKLKQEPLYAKGEKYRQAEESAMSWEAWVSQKAGKAAESMLDIDTGYPALTDIAKVQMMTTPQYGILKGIELATSQPAESDILGRVGKSFIRTGVLFGALDVPTTLGRIAVVKEAMEKDTAKEFVSMLPSATGEAAVQIVQSWPELVGMGAGIAVGGYVTEKATPGKVKDVSLDLEGTREAAYGTDILAEQKGVAVVTYENGATVTYPVEATAYGEPSIRAGAVKGEYTLDVWSTIGKEIAEQKPGTTYAERPAIKGGTSYVSNLFGTLLEKGSEFFGFTRKAGEIEPTASIYTKNIMLQGEPSIIEQWTITSPKMGEQTITKAISKELTLKNIFTGEEEVAGGRKITPGKMTSADIATWEAQTEEMPFRSGVISGAKTESIFATPETEVAGMTSTENIFATTKGRTTEISFEGITSQELVSAEKVSYGTLKELPPKYTAIGTGWKDITESVKLPKFTIAEETAAPKTAQPQVLPRLAISGETAKPTAPKTAETPAGKGMSLMLELPKTATAETTVTPKTAQLFIEADLQSVLSEQAKAKATYKAAKISQRADIMTAGQVLTYNPTQAMLEGQIYAEAKPKVSAATRQQLEPGLVYPTLEATQREISRSRATQIEKLDISSIMPDTISREKYKATGESKLIEDVLPPIVTPIEPSPIIDIETITIPETEQEQEPGLKKKIIITPSPFIPDLTKTPIPAKLEQFSGGIFYGGGISGRGTRQVNVYRPSLYGIEFKMPYVKKGTLTGFEVRGIQTAKSYRTSQVRTSPKRKGKKKAAPKSKQKKSVYRFSTKIPKLPSFSLSSLKTAMTNSRRRR